MRILILGGAGFLGSNLVRRCLRDGIDQVTVLDSLDPRLKSDATNLDEVRSSIEFVHGDIGDADLMAELTRDQDVIFNCAGQTSHSISLEDPLFDAQINCLGNLTVLEAMRRGGSQARVIYTSSSTVVGRGDGTIVTESHNDSPRDVYSANKGVAEKYYTIYHLVHGLSTLSIRFANLYGPYGKGFPEFGFINYFISLAAAGREITVFGDGSQTRNVMYVGDAVDLLYKCASFDRLVGGVFFAVHREHYSVREIAETIIEVFGQGTLVWTDWPRIRERIEVGDVVISGARLYHETGWEPRSKLREGLAETKLIMASGR